MIRKLIVAAAAVCAMSAPAFAQSDNPSDLIFPADNGSVSAKMMSDNHTVMMKIKLPHDAFLTMTAQNAGHPMNCSVKEIYPGVSDTMILVCQ